MDTTARAFWTRDVVRGSAEECRRHIDKACPPGCPIPRERPLLRTVSLPAPRPAVQDDNDLIYRPAPAAVEQVVELHEEE